MNLDPPAGFAGVVRVRHGETVEFEQGYGLADPAYRVPFAAADQFAIASATVASTVGEAAFGVCRQAREEIGW